MRQTVVDLVETTPVGRRAGRWLRRQRIRYRSTRGAFTPWIPERIDDDRLVSEISRFFGLGVDDVRRLYDEYQRLHEDRRYAEKLGELKTLNFGEAFILYVIMATYRPAGPIVEIGSFYGSSTRRILDGRDHLGLDNEVVCFDIEDNIEHFRPDEARLMLQDVTGSVTRDVLDRFEPGLIYLDAHPYGLLESVISETLAHPRPCILAIHDCSFGLCNPAISLDKDDPDITSENGLWERYVLCKVFGVANPMSTRLDDLETATHKLRIFSTTHGLAVIFPKSLTAAMS